MIELAIRSAEQTGLPALLKFKVEGIFTNILWSVNHAD
jgi:hypothetical protein